MMKREHILLIAGGLVGLVIIMQLTKRKRQSQQGQNINAPNVADLEANSFAQTIYNPMGMYAL